MPPEGITHPSLKGYPRAIFTLDRIYHTVILIPKMGKPGNS
jgi:hypothetical protein